MNNLLRAEYYELQFMQVLPYELGFGWNMTEKVDMVHKICTYLAERNIHVRFSDRIVDNVKEWTRPAGETWRPVEVGELCGNMIVINPRNIDFLSVLLTIAHIYGHLVQRMEEAKYEPLTRFATRPKPLNLTDMQAEYEACRPGQDYKADFLAFEKEAFGYGKYALLQAGIVITPQMDHAIQAYIQADFDQLWEWWASAENKSGDDFVKAFEQVYNTQRFQVLQSIPIEVDVLPKADGQLVVVRA